MQIVTASDGNYLAGVLVLIASAHRHNPQARFTLLGNDLSTDSKIRVQKLARQLECEIQIIDIATSKLQSLEVRRNHLTRACFSRLFIPELLIGQDRVIYMDCDMLVTGPLDAAWNTPLESHHMLAAVPCPTPTQSTLDSLEIQKGDYFNSGFLVFDLETWRRNRIGEICLEKLASAENQHLIDDEAAMNDVCRGRYRKLPSGYNFYAIDGTFQDALNDPRTIRNIHYVKTPKPWHHRVPLSALWHYEAAKISDPIPMTAKPPTARQRISMWNGKRKLWMGRLAGRAEYRDSAAIKAYLDDIVIPSYIANGNMTQITPPSPPFKKPGQAEAVAAR